MSASQTTSTVQAPWPIAKSRRVSLTGADLSQTDTYAKKLISDTPGLSSKFHTSLDAGAAVRAGWLPGPTIYIEDHREIQLATDALSQRYEYRSMALAGNNDFIIVSRKRVPRFEQYLCETLELGAPTVITIPSTQPGRHKSLAKACINDPSAMQTLVAAARTAGGMNIIPFLASGNVWLLASSIAKAAGVEVRVAAASPKLSHLANDKLWFSQCVKDLLGQNAIPPTISVFGLSAAAGALRYLAQKSKQLVLKLPSSAGSMGNVMFKSSSVRNKPLNELRDQLLGTLRTIGWSEDYPLLVGIWEPAVLSSPSAQLWIPSPEEGPPIIEGIFIQSVQGDAGRFTGAVTACLPDAIDRNISYQALVLGTLLQKLGYFGRVSFDSLLVGDNIEDAEIHWVECNARWGGVSIPMTIMHRITTEMNTVEYTIVQRVVEDQLEMNFDKILARFEGQLFGQFNHHSGIVWLTPLGKHDETAIFVAIGSTREEANRVALNADNLLAQLQYKPDNKKAREDTSLSVA